jgi:RNA methyltransferase, TrmH family
MLEITSKDNSRLKHARAVRDGKISTEIFIEGLRLAEEVLTSNLEVTDYFFTPEFPEAVRGAKLLKNLEGARGAILSGKLFASIADTKTPQGIVILAARPQTGKNNFANKLNSIASPLVIILHRLNNPANVGAILRTAEAAGATGAILTRESADAFSPKSLRGAMGAAFRLPIWADCGLAEAMEFCRAAHIQTVCADVRAAKTHVEIDWTHPRAVVVGSEAHGLSNEEIALADETLKIPMKSDVESLNAAVACGVVLYEAARQRFLSSKKWFESEK